MKSTKLRVMLATLLIVIGPLISCIVADFGYTITASLLAVVTVVLGCVLLKKWIKQYLRERTEEIKKRGY